MYSIKVKMKPVYSITSTFRLNELSYSPFTTRGGGTVATSLLYIYTNKPPRFARQYEPAILMFVYFEGFGTV